MSRVVGCVPYVNARPLVAWFDDQGSSSPVKVVYEVPSRLPTRLNNGSVEAVLASSFESLRTPDMRIAEGVSISTLGPAESVRLFSKVPFTQIGSLALDQSSLTSNHLALGLLAERYSVRPFAEPRSPVLSEMLDTFDAAILIGDRGMLADGTGLHVMDLGQEWVELTGLPFVWALWMGGDALNPELSAHLLHSAEWGRANLSRVIRETQQGVEWPAGWCERYLTHTMDYGLTERHLCGLSAYADLLKKHSLLSEPQVPTLVPAALGKV